MVRKVNTNLGSRSPAREEREAIDEIGVDEVPEDRQNVRHIRKGRKQA